MFFATQDQLRNNRSIVYCVVNLINGKRYVGQTRRAFYPRYRKQWWQTNGINKHLRNSVLEYGIENFRICILKNNLSHDALIVWENFFIKLYKSENRNFGYNTFNPNKAWTAEYGDKISFSNRKTIGQFLHKAKKIHKDKYDYSKVDSAFSCRRVQIICNNCKNLFLQTINSHLAGHGCPVCATEENRKKKIKSFPEFVQKANIKWNNQFFYYRDNYVNSKSKLKICHKICNTVFYQTGNRHLYGFGCPTCQRKRYLMSIGAKEIIRVDQYKNIVEFDCVSVAAFSCGLKTGGIIDARCKGLLNHIYLGYQWFYKEDYEKLKLENKIP